MISEETIKQVKESVDIIALVGRYVELKQKGHDFWGCCPFHQEKTPSFKVSPERNTWHCFGCGESGNVITFVMKAEGVSFVQAVERLAAFAGIPLDAEALEKSGRELESLFAWLRKNPDIGEFDEVLVAERYIALRSEHETAVKRGKPGWMHTPANQVRDELVREARAEALKRESPSMSPDLSHVLAPACVRYELPGGNSRRIFSIEPAPTEEFIETLTSRVWNLSDGIPYTLIRELCENFIHAYFEDVEVTISCCGRRIVFSDGGPGPNWEDDFQRAGYSTATEPMKRYIRSIGSGLSIVKEQCEAANSHISLIFGNRHGKGFSAYLVAAEEEGGRNDNAE